MRTIPRSTILFEISCRDDYRAVYCRVIGGIWEPAAQPIANLRAQFLGLPSARNADTQRPGAGCHADPRRLSAAWLAEREAKPDYSWSSITAARFAATYKLGVSAAHILAMCHTPRHGGHHLDEQ